MEINLGAWWRKLLFAAACLAVALLYLSVALPEYAAHWLSLRAEAGSLRRAVRLSPWNAEHHRRLARYSIHAESDLPAATSSLQTAIHLNPYSAAYWLDLALVYATSGDVAAQQRAVEAAIRTEPTTPDVAWQAANFYVIQGDVARALANFRIVVENDLTRSEAAVKLALRVSGDARPVLAILPPAPEPHLILLYALVNQDRLDEAKLVWERLERLQSAFPPKRALPYFESLILAREVAQAQHVWTELVRRNAEWREYADPHNGVVNGGFEEPVLNGGFDWRYRAQPQVEIGLDSVQFHSGTRSLLLHFKGPAFADAGIAQLLVLRPGAQYELTAHTRSEDLITTSGPRVAVVDAFTNQWLASSEEIRATTTWHSHVLRFKAGPDTKLAAIRVLRDPAGSLVKGKLWIDDLQLTHDGP